MPNNESKYFEAWVHYENVLRTWFVAYGIGVPFLYFTDDSIRVEVQGHTYSLYLVAAFGIGVFIQVFFAALYKVAAWRLYLGDTGQIDPVQDTDWAKRVALWTKADFAIDAITIALFVAATIGAVCILQT